ncbi:substrate-binding domain-containing protein [Flavobacterium sp. GA093]|uniref:Substrate-binding domain-containing protein n=1 Tax=Flavobacterium hydrocarbonoxydans TaxID=2683249 RepID=A0A6I4NNF1_9FLAO|nr:substrate-binding domain-containing protein [Flavobacterium hydrocarbonoxydans]MWB94065.1 substrate-binding domain-containing protein [Flavobacterium hydrocarbonoxydans]
MLISCTHTCIANIYKNLNKKSDYWNKKINFTTLFKVFNLNLRNIITIKKIAELANVSPGTVDRIIHKRGQVSQENIDKVNAIIEKYGFKRNIFASNLASNKKCKIAVFLPKSEKLEYWESQLNGIEKAAEDFGKFGVELHYFLYDFNTVSFQKMCTKVLDFECEGLLFSPIFHEESLLFLDEYKKKDIPVVMIDSDIKDKIPHYYIGQDAFQSGYLAGRLISFAVKNDRNVLIVKVAKEIESTSVYLQRIKGFYAFFEEHPELTNFTFSEITIKDPDVNQLTLEMFQDISSIFVPNSRAYIVAQFLEQHHIKGIRIIGYDLLKENITYLNSGIIDFLINQKPEEQGYMGVNYLYKKIILHENLEETHFMQLDIIVKENYTLALKK